MAEPRKRRGLSSNQKAVFAALKAAGKPITAYELIDVLRPQGIAAPPTVYRALERLITDGLAHRIESLNAFVACCQDKQHDGPVIFTICEDCGQADEFSDEALSHLLASQARKHRFTVEKATLELRGYCANCDTAKGEDR